MDLLEEATVTNMPPLPLLTARGGDRYENCLFTKGEKVQHGTPEELRMPASEPQSAILDDPLEAFLFGRLLLPRPFQPRSSSGAAIRPKCSFGAEVHKQRSGGSADFIERPSCPGASEVRPSG